jgi:hypothetical protein
MAWGGAEAAALMQTREDEVENLCTRKGVGASQQMQGGQAPVQAVEPEVLGEPVVDLVFALRWSGSSSAITCVGRRTESRLWM